MIKNFQQTNQHQKSDLTDLNKGHHMITDIEIEKLRAETVKLQSETALNNKKLKWFEVALVIAGTLAIAAVARATM